jgi:hypothetical protein
VAVRAGLWEGDLGVAGHVSICDAMRFPADSPKLGQRLDTMTTIQPVLALTTVGQIPAGGGLANVRELPASEPVALWPIAQIAFGKSDTQPVGRGQRRREFGWVRTDYRNFGQT